jgi:hypothetical protein
LRDVFVGLDGTHCSPFAFRVRCASRSRISLRIWVGRS